MICNYNNEIYYCVLICVFFYRNDNYIFYHVDYYSYITSNCHIGYSSRKEVNYMNKLPSIAMELYLNLSKVINADNGLDVDTKRKIKFFRDNAVTSNDLMKMTINLEFLKYWQNKNPDVYNLMIDMASTGTI